MPPDEDALHKAMQEALRAAGLMGSVDEPEGSQTNGRDTDPPPGYDEPPRPPKPRGTRHGRLLVLGMDDLDTAPPRDYLLKGIISRNEISIWVGPPKCGKSFLMLYIAYMLALGRPVFGRRVKPAKIFYVAAEGEAGINKRLQALRDKYGHAANFHYIAQPIDLLRDGGHKAEIIAAAKAVSADLIVIDTLNRAIPGGMKTPPWIWARS